MKLKIFCRCSLFPSWSGYGLISTPVLLAFSFLGNNLLCSVGGFVEEENVLPQDFERNPKIVSIRETVLLAVLFHTL